MEKIIRKNAQINKVWARGASLLKKWVIESDLAYAEDLDAFTDQGPFIEFRTEDALGRLWPAGRITLRVHSTGDELFCLNKDGQKQDVYQLNVNLFGDCKRFVANLVEQTGGQLPFWLAPEQVRVIAVKKEQNLYADELTRKLEKKGIRVRVDKTAGSLSSRVFQAKREMVPYIVIAGKKEVEHGTITVTTFENDRNEQVEMIDEWVDHLLKGEKNRIESK